MFSFHTKTPNRSFQLHSLWRAFSKSSIFKMFLVHIKTPSRGVLNFIHSGERFTKVPFLKCSRSTLKRLARVFKFIHAGERFRKVAFLCVFGEQFIRISVDGRPNHIISENSVKIQTREFVTFLNLSYRNFTPFSN